MTVVLLEAIECLADIGVNKLLRILKNATSPRDRLQRRAHQALDVGGGDIFRTPLLLLLVPCQRVVRRLIDAVTVGCGAAEERILVLLAVVALINLLWQDVGTQLAETHAERRRLLLILMPLTFLGHVVAAAGVPHTLYCLVALLHLNLDVIAVVGRCEEELA